MTGAEPPVVYQVLRSGQSRDYSDNQEIIKIYFSFLSGHSTIFPSVHLDKYRIYNGDSRPRHIYVFTKLTFRAVVEVQGMGEEERGCT